MRLYIDFCAETLILRQHQQWIYITTQKANDSLEPSTITDYPKTCQNFVEQFAGVNTPKSVSNQFSALVFNPSCFRSVVLNLWVITPKRVIWHFKRGNVN